MARKNKYIIPAILTGLSGFGLYLLGNVMNASNNLRYTLGAVKLSYKNLRLLAEIELIITNPTRQSLKFKHFTGKLYADSNFLGYVDIPNETTIQAKSDTTVKLSTVIPASSIVDLFMDNLMKFKMPSKGKLTGIATVGSVQIPVNETFEFNQPATKSTKTTAKK
jgi:LEA14-like dessication related protein